MLRAQKRLFHNSFKFRIRNFSTVPRRTQALLASTMPSSEINPTSTNIRPNLFSSHREAKVENYLSIALDTYPSPLYSMSQDAISKLTTEEYKHLLKIPYKDVSETHSFCLSIIRIITETIITNTSRATHLYRLIEDEELKFVIREALERVFSDDPIRSSILSWMIDPTSKKARKHILHNILRISEQTEKSKEEKSMMVLAYFGKLAEINIVNTYPLVWKSAFVKLVSHFSPTQYRELYSYLVQLNIRPNDDNRLATLKTSLLEGSNLDKYVAMTGWVNPKWHHTARSEYPPLHIEKMVNFFTMEDLKTSAFYYIQNSDIYNSKLYMELLVAKFELKFDVIQKLGFQVTPRVWKKDIQLIYDTILFHTMTYKGALSFIKVLKYFMSNKLDVTVGTLLTVMKILRKQKYFNEALTIVNHLQLDSLSETEKQSLVEEILLLIDAKFPHSPKVLLGYIATIFNKEGDEVLNMLNDMGLPKLIYKESLGEPFDSLQKANVDPRLCGLKLTPTILSHFYRTVLDSSDSLKHEDILDLYRSYRVIVKKHQASGSDLFNQANMSDTIVKHMVEHLLKTAPSVASIEKNLKVSVSSFDTAKSIMRDFLKEFSSIPRKNRSVYLFDLLINSSLKKHNEFKFASEMLLESRKLGLPFTYHQLYPFIVHHYACREYDIAEKWYNELVNSGAKVTARSAKEMFRIARELNWKSTGFVYRKFLIHKSHRSRELMNELLVDPIAKMRGSIDPEDVITDEVIDVDSEEGNTEDQILSLLDQLRHPIDSDID